MPVVPRPIVSKIQYAEDHVAPFTANTVAIGTTTADVTDFTTKTTAARTAYTAQQAAQSVAKAATLTLQNAVDAMSVSLAGIIKQVGAKAETTGNPDVYALAQIPAPATPSPVGPPGQPSNFAVELNGDGSLILTWKCVNPAGGTMYQLFRQIAGVGDFDHIGGTGEKKFVDMTIPAGATQLTYKVQAQRTTGAGMFATFNVYFGTNAGGTMTASVVETLAKKAA